MITTKENQGQQQTQPDADAAALEAALRAGQELVRKHFRGVSDLHVERVVDPESGELVSEITFDVPGREQDIQDAHLALTRAWVSAYPEPVRRFIRFIFFIV
jgi:hypothetical protein